MNIIVFDTGTGGYIFADHLKKELPNTNITTVIVGDDIYLGDKTPAEIQAITESTLAPYLSDSHNLIFLACNTATAYAIDYLREAYPEMTFVGTEPMLKPASEITNPDGSTIVVLATPATEKSPRYLQLKADYLKNFDVIEPSCSSWAKLIDQHALSDNLIKDVLAHYISTPPNTIVLACTHYIKLKPTLHKMFPNATILSPLEPITNHIKELLAQPQTARHGQNNS